VTFRARSNLRTASGRSNRDESNTNDCVTLRWSRKLEIYLTKMVDARTIKKDISVILGAGSNVKTVLGRLYYDKYNARAALLHL
jgi:hypothetical protein